MNRILRMFALLGMIVAPVVFFVMDNRQVLKQSENSDATKDHRKSDMIFSHNYKVHTDY